VTQGVRHDPLGFDDLYSLGSTERSPREPITYTVHAHEGGTGEVTTAPFTFHVTDRSTAAHVTGATDNHQSVDFTLTDSAPGLSPKLRICFPGLDCFHVQVAPGGEGLTVSGQAVYTGDTDLRRARS